MFFSSPGTIRHGVIHMSSKNHNVRSSHHEDYDIDIHSCSTMDCTGLIPSLPQSDAEVEHYNQLYQFLPEHLHDPEKGG